MLVMADAVSELRGIAAEYSECGEYEFSYSLSETDTRRVLVELRIIHGTECTLMNILKQNSEKTTVPKDLRSFAKSLVLEFGFTADSHLGIISKFKVQGTVLLFFNG